jgi:hypothetical protein
MMMDKNVMCEKQVESCILSIPCDRLSEIMLSPKMDFCKMMPCSVKCQTVIKGTMGCEGCVMKLELVDGSVVESEVTFRDPVKCKISYKVLSSTAPCYKDCGEVTSTIRMRPVTFCGCPFMQCINDKVVCKMGCPLKDVPVKASEKTFLEWRTKCTKPIPMEKMELIRSMKLTLLSDMMKDMAGEKAMLDMRRSMMDMDMFVAKKLGASSDVPMVSVGSKCPMGMVYTFDQAKMDAARYCVPDMKTGSNSP